MQITFPKDYAEFLKAYGGGYFGYTVVYSCDSDSSFYLPNHVTNEWIHTYHFLPVIDFETGDWGGFKIKDNICGHTVRLFDHEQNSVTENSNMDFFQFLLNHGLAIETQE